MPDIPIDGVVYSLDGGETYRFRQGTGDFSATDIAVDPTPWIARAAGPALEGSTLAALTAPARVSDPVLSGSAVLGGTLTRQSPGVVTGNPPPEMGSPLWAMRADSNAAAQIVESASGETMSVDDAVFDVGHQIRTGTRFWNSQGEITLWSPWVEVTEVPQITAEPFTLTAGQSTTIRFNTAVNTVTVAQGSTTLTATRVGTTNDWTVIPATTEPVAIGATKAGWKEYSATITPAAALANIIKTQSNRLQFENVDQNTPPEPLTMTGPYAGTRPVDFASMASGPVFHVNPSQTWTGEPGDPITFDEGLVLNFESAGPVIMSVDMYVDATLKQGVGAADYIRTDNDAGKTITRRVVLEDNKGVRPPYITNGIAIPAAAIPAAGIADGVTELGFFDGGIAGSSSVTNTAEIPLGGVDAGKTIYVWLAADKSVSDCKIEAGGVDYPGAVLENKTIASTGARLILLQIPCSAGGTGTLQVTGTGTTIRPRGRVQAVKNRTLVATLDTAFNFTAGTALASSAGATLVGDTLIQTLLITAANDNGVISASFLPEIYDAPVTPTGPQLWMGKGTETAASGNRTLSVTPNATADYACVIAVFRNA